MNLTVYRRQEFEQRTTRYVEEFMDRLKKNHKKNHPNGDLEIEYKVIQREGNSGDQRDVTTPDDEIG